MNLEKIMEEIDQLYSQQKVEEVEALLLEKLDILKKNKEIHSALSLQNELLGIYREKGDVTKGKACCQELISLFQDNNLKKDENYGTTLLNIATAQRSFGEYDLAKDYYDECMEIYRNKLPPNDYRYASLYNNMNLLCCELGEFSQAIDHLEKSLAILSQHQGVEVQIATANTSLAQIYSGLENMDLAEKHMNMALDIFEKHEDYHYSGALATAANLAFLQKDYEKSAILYEQAMEEIEKYLGKTENYKMLEENLHYVQEFLPEKKTEPSRMTSPSSTSCEKNLPVKGLALSKAFYEEFGVPMIETHFPQYAEKIAVGLVGEGSECFGFDDQYSHDHDFGAGFCLWLQDEDYNIIGQTLQTHYDKLPKNYGGIPYLPSPNAPQRVGVFRISAFYERLTGLDSAPIFEEEWLMLEESQLAHACNGAVFRDDLGAFSEIRQCYLNHYPEDILRKKLAVLAHDISQKGQYNFQRSLNRGDFVTARLIMTQFVTDVINMACLLNKTYMPYYKWVFCKLKTLPRLSHLSSIIHKLLGYPIDDDRVPVTMERIVGELLLELEEQGIIQKRGNENFLDLYVEEILNHVRET